MLSKTYYIYILTNISKTLYVGVTNDLQSRMALHRQKLNSSFSKQYNLTMLVYYETAEDVMSAIAREKQIKGWRRSKKISLIESKNPKWEDLSLKW